jgi:hypothetical protein
MRLPLNTTNPYSWLNLHKSKVFDLQLHTRLQMGVIAV